ncbi:MAG: AAA family ATPase [Cytophagales bacterium]|nr:AAA family ATPase [Cytophagales bacterium]
MTDIFVSYASEDRERVAHLVSKLSGYGWKIWWDREIKTGKSFEIEIEQAIDKAKCIIVVWSHASIESEWVRAEANEGLDRKILIPVTIDDVRPPLAYRRLQTTFIVGWPDGNHEDQFQRLLASIHGLLDFKKVDSGRGKITSQSERRYITALTCKLNEYSESTDPETYHEQSQHLKQVILQLVTRFSGFLYHYGGSHFVVVFGIPTTHEEDTLYAVNLAIQIQSRIKSIQSRRKSDGTSIQVSIQCSITRGIVIVSKENSRLNEYSLTGNVIEEGSRLLDRTNENEIIISESAYKIIANNIHAEPIKLEKTLVYKPERTIITSRIDAARSKDFTEYCGRENETNQIHNLYTTVSKGSGQVVTIIGEAGIGKSRLLFETRQRLPLSEIYLLEGQCQPYGRDTAYYPYLGMLRQYLKLENTPQVELHDTAVRVLKTIFNELEQFIPHYLYLLSIPSESYRLPAHLQGETMRLALQEALISVLAVIAKRKPTVLIFEDWHWADETSTAVLQHLIHVAMSFPMLIIISCRPEFHPSWTSLEHCSLLKLNSFSEDHTRTMIAHLAKAEEIPNQLVKDFHERTNGNPFFIEELVACLFEQGKISIRKGKLSVKDGIENLVLPDSIQAVLRTRLDQLDSEAQEILCAASVIGREFSRTLLEITCGKSVDAVLRGLIEIGIVSPTRVFPNPEYTFKHALIQVVAYETMLVKFRKELHQQVAKNILKLYPEAVEENTEVLAYHFSISEDNVNAIKYSILAGGAGISPKCTSRGSKTSAQCRESS